MSVDKYPSIFSDQMEALVYIYRYPERDENQSQRLSEELEGEDNKRLIESPHGLVP